MPNVPAVGVDDHLVCVRVCACVCIHAVCGDCQLFELGSKSNVRGVRIWGQSLGQGWGQG